MVDKQTLLAGVWPDLHVEESNLRTQIAGLRRALGAEGNRYVVNIAGRGYSFAGAISRRPEPAKIASPSPAPAGRLSTPPRRATRVIGREQDITVVAELLSAHRLVTIHGPGGIGKTTVACAVADALAEQFPDGICFLDLSLLEEGGSLPDALAAALGLVVQSSDPRPNIISHLRNQQTLLIFDCCEPVIDAAAALAEALCIEVPGVHILTTSREPMRAEGEHIYILPPMGMPPKAMPPVVEELLSYPAAILFYERAVASGHRQSLGEADVPVVAEICRKVDGVALAWSLPAGGSARMASTRRHRCSTAISSCSGPAAARRRAVSKR